MEGKSTTDSQKRRQSKMVVEWSFEMHQHKDTYHTIEDLSPEAKQDSRKYLEQHCQKRI